MRKRKVTFSEDLLAAVDVVVNPKTENRERNSHQNRTLLVQKPIEKMTETKWPKPQNRKCWEKVMLFSRPKKINL